MTKTIGNYPDICDVLDIPEQENDFDFAQLVVAEILLRSRTVSKNDVISHPLGFTRIRLNDWDASDIRISLNLWPIGGETDTCDIHDHCYDFTSMCLVGELVHEVYELVDCNGDVSGDLASYCAGTCIGASRREGLAHLRLAETFSVSAPSVYGFANDKLHRAFAVGRSLITLQLQGPYVKDEALVIKNVPRVQHRGLIPSILAQPAPSFDEAITMLREIYG